MKMCPQVAIRIEVAEGD
ncbi:MAG: hypothetical protein MUP85_06380 [Candidatus Lokiarchaeota archaeon]|nr:hypothetical protein [Candidatus Lokiarchaeota archaeon]